MPPRKKPEVVGFDVIVGDSHGDAMTVFDGTSGVTHTLQVSDGRITCPSQQIAEAIAAAIAADTSTSPTPGDG